MRKLIIVSVVLLSLTTLPVFAQQRKGRPSPRTGRNLTVALAQGILNRQINAPAVDNMLLTCRACYSPEDKGENDNFVVVSTYSTPIDQFLIRQGYIRNSRNGRVFTAKAKRSKYFEGFGDGYGGFGGAGFRFADFKNPKILVRKIRNLNHVPIEYDFVPTELTTRFFGRIKRINSFASFSFDAGKWTVCIGCRSLR